LEIVVTGGAGFIGSNLVRGLLATDHGVRVVDNLSTGSARNLQGLEDQVSMIREDVRNVEALRKAMVAAEVVVHLAALPSVARSVADPVRSHSVNVNGTVGTLVAARDAGVRRVVYASSSSIYGDTPTLPKHEGMVPSPLSPYAASKLAGEAYCQAFARVYDLETISLRFFNVFGPRQDPGSEYAAVIPKFVTRMLAGRRPVIFGDGRQSRDFTFVESAVRACSLAATAGPQAVGEAVNVAGGSRTSLLDLVSLLNGIIGTSIEPEHADPRPGDVRHSEASIEKAGELLGYRPAIDVAAGLRATVDWFAEEPPREQTRVT
jgi:UDP-N-acetylglucosamine/UDP-N-acetyl-alpha-D-glucosaminouronate 4-epimerase